MTAACAPLAAADVPTLDESGLKGFQRRHLDRPVRAGAHTHADHHATLRAAKISLADLDVRQKLIAGGKQHRCSDTQEFTAFPGGRVPDSGAGSSAWQTSTGRMTSGAADRGIAGQGSDRMSDEVVSTR